MFQTFQLFFTQTAVHVPDFHLFLIREVDIFQCFCWAVAIQAVVHFGLKLASARQDMYGILFWFSSRFIYFCHLLKQCRAIEILVSSSLLSRWISSRWPFSLSSMENIKTFKNLKNVGFIFRCFGHSSTLKDYVIS